MTCQCRSMSRTLAASSTQRLVSQAQGHSGSNQKSTRALVGALCTASVIVGPPRSSRSARRSRRPSRWCQSGSARGLFPPTATRCRAAPGRCVVPAWEACPCGRTQSDPHRRRRPRRTPGRAGLRPAARRHRRRRPPRRAHVPRRPRPSSSAAAQPGAETFIDLVADTVHSATLNGDRARREHLHRGRRAAAARPGGAEHARRHRRLPLLQHRRGSAPLRGPRGRAGLPLHAVRAGRRQADVRLLRPARPQGHVHAARRRAVRLAGRLQHRWPDDRGRPRRLPARALRADQADLDLPRRADRRALRQGHRLARGHPARAVLPRVAGQVPRPRRALPRDQAGLRLLPPGLRLPVPVRQVRPAVRARVQRRGHGERRRGHLPGGLRLPVEGQPGAATSGARRRCCTSWRTCGSATW